MLSTGRSAVAARFIRDAGGRVEGDPRPELDGRRHLRSAARRGGCSAPRLTDLVKTVSAGADGELDPWHCWRSPSSGQQRERQSGRTGRCSRAQTPGFDDRRRTRAADQPAGVAVAFDDKRGGSRGLARDTHARAVGAESVTMKASSAAAQDKRQRHECQGPPGPESPHLSRGPSEG